MTLTGPGSGTPSVSQRVALINAGNFGIDPSSSKNNPIIFDKKVTSEVSVSELLKFFQPDNTQLPKKLQQQQQQLQQQQQHQQQQQQQQQLQQQQQQHQQQHQHQQQQSQHQQQHQLQQQQQQQQHQQQHQQLQQQQQQFQQQQQQQQQQPIIPNPQNSQLNKNLGLFNTQTNKYEFTTLGPNPRHFSFDRLEFLKLLQYQKSKFTENKKYNFFLNATDNANQTYLDIIPLETINSPENTQQDSNEKIVQIPNFTFTNNIESIDLNKLPQLIKDEEDKQKIKSLAEYNRSLLVPVVPSYASYVPSIWTTLQSAIPYQNYSQFIRVVPKQEARTSLIGTWSPLNSSQPPHPTIRVVDTISATSRTLSTIQTYLN